MNTNESNQLLEYLRALRRRWRVVALIVVIVTGTALVVSVSGEKQYDATASLLLRNDEPVTSLLDPRGSSGSNDPERDLNTDVELVKVAGVAHAAQRKLRTTQSTDDLLDKISVETSSSSDIVTLKARDKDPARAARIANAFAEAYVEFRTRQARSRYEDTARLAQQQLDQLSPQELASAQGQALRARQRELQLTASLQSGGAEIVRRASVPTSAATPKPKVAGALGLLLGLLLGAAAVIALEVVDRRLKDENALEEFFGLPLLGVIPRAGRRGTSVDDPGQREAYGLLAANLRFSILTGRSNVVLVTSPSPGDGKTSVTFGLARALARLNLRVIAVEADLRRPAFGRHADVQDSVGLTGVLNGSPLEQELVWLDAGTLAPPVRGAAEEPGQIAVLPAGDLPGNPQSTLSQPGMRAVIEAARARADVVLIDTAPIGTVNDPITMTRLVDAVVLVARLNQTTKDAGRRALRVLRNMGLPLTGVVATGAASGHRYDYYSAESDGQESPPEPTGVQGRHG
jgi:succinoglycan biosynthesis transport protein ExoP